MPPARRHASDCDPVDVYVGRRLRDRRAALGLSQAKLAASVGISVQQIQKYERGVNRIGASRLFEVARVLGVGVDYFFDGMAADGTAPPASGGANSTREAQALARAFNRIPDRRLQQDFLELVLAMAELPADSSGGAA